MFPVGQRCLKVVSLAYQYYIDQYDRNTIKEVERVGSQKLSSFDMKDVTLTRKELYDLVWSEPVSTILKKYFLTDPEFRKICASMEIPFPKSGHWQKVKAGKNVVHAIFSNEYKGETEVKLLQLEEQEKDLVALTPLEELQKEIERDPKLPLIVPQNLTNPHKLILKAKEVLTTKDTGYGRYYGMINCCWDDALDIRVSPSCVVRALCFMDTLIKLLFARGHNVIIENRSTYAIVQNEKIKIAFREKSRRETVKENRWERLKMYQ